MEHIEEYKIEKLSRHAIFFAHRTKFSIFYTVCMFVGSSGIRVQAQASVFVTLNFCVDRFAYFSLCHSSTLCSYIVCNFFLLYILRFCLFFQLRQHRSFSLCFQWIFVAHFFAFLFFILSLVVNSIVNHSHANIFFISKEHNVNME